MYALILLPIKTKFDMLSNCVKSLTTNLPAIETLPRTCRTLVILIELFVLDQIPFIKSRNFTAQV